MCSSYKLVRSRICQEKQNCKDFYSKTGKIRFIAPKNLKVEFPVEMAFVWTKV